MATKNKSPWGRITTFDEGEVNPLPGPSSSNFLDGGENVVERQNFILEDLLYNKKIQNTGPFLAVVLKVLSGPQVNNEATTNGGNLTNSLNVRGLRQPTIESRELQQKPAPIKVIARIPEVHNLMSWPESVDDEDVISFHSEFHQFDENSDFELIRPGSLIWVQYYSLDHIASKSGLPSGIILGLYDRGAPIASEAILSATEEFKPPCKAFRNLAEPGGGIYRGSTEANPVLLPGPPIVKFKNRIPTGLFGNGSLATKSNFNRCLQLADPSFKHNIPGAAPDANNAFIWVGQLRNNGYFDILNRPGIGRETIIYAPYTLDINAPIEIKYYFHDKDGFGNAFISGRDNQADAEQSAAAQPSDFKNKIAPSIKDFVKDGRNIILVIPELLHSKGLSTRIGLSSSDKETFAEQLEKVRISEGNNLSQITPLINRGVKSFNRTAIGGNFIDFHGEVLNVIDSYLSNASQRVDYVSLVGDGLGGVTIAAMCENEETAIDIRNDFKIQRVDFIDTGLDKASTYPSTFLLSRIPSVSIYLNLVKPSVDEEARKLQFNYIATPSPAGTSNFFNVLSQINAEPVDVLSLFKQNNSAPSGIGEKKFTIPVSFPDTIGDATDVVLSFHTTKKQSNLKTGYALTMQNLDGNQITIIKPDTNSGIFAGANKVPDHADASAAAQAAADIAKIEKKKNDLLQRIIFFEVVVLNWITLGIDQPCKDDGPYKIYCKDGILDFSKGTRFFNDYLNYLTDKIDLAELNIISEFESQLLQGSVSAEQLTSLKQDIAAPDGFLAKAKQKIKQPYAAFGGVLPEDSLEILKKRFDVNDFSTPAAMQSIDTPGTPAESFPELTNLCNILSAPAAYQKIIYKIDNTIEKLKSRAVKLSPDCKPPPLKLGDLVSQKTNDGEYNSPDVFDCEGLKISLVSSFADLNQMIDYVPDKKRFTFQNGASKTKTKLDQVDAFEVRSFRYKSRSALGQINVKESPPVWSCIADKLSQAWETACNQSNYVPFEILNGIRGYDQFKGTTAYDNGMSLHAFGMAFDLDPYIAAYSPRGAVMVHSVFTGAWSQSFMAEHAKELCALGVFQETPESLLQNAVQAASEVRTAENWQGAPSAYDGVGPEAVNSERYNEIMNKSKGTIISTEQANPTLWVLAFCEISKMRWGNLNFLKRRFRNGKIWTSGEKERISEIYNIPNIVDRVKEISWKSSNIESHMHFQFWNGGSLVPWSDIEKFAG